MKKNSGINKFACLLVILSILGLALPGMLELKTTILYTIIELGLFFVAGLVLFLQNRDKNRKIADASDSGTFRKFRVSYVICVAATIVFIVFIISNTYGNGLEWYINISIAVFAIITAVISFFIGFKKQNKLQKIFKDNVDRKLKPLLFREFNTTEFKPGGRIEYKAAWTLNETIAQKGFSFDAPDINDIYDSGSCLFEGEYKGNSFEFSNLKLTKRTLSGYKPLFSGIAIRCYTPKKLNAKKIDEIINRLSDIGKSGRADFSEFDKSKNKKNVLVVLVKSSNFFTDSYGPEALYDEDALNEQVEFIKSVLNIILEVI